MPIIILILALCISTPLYADPTPAPQDDVAELVKIQEEQQKAFQPMNQNNPLSTDFTPPDLSQLKPDPNTPLGMAASGGLASVQRMLASPMTQGLLRLFADPILAKSVDSLAKNPNLNLLGYYELGWFFFFIIFRAWRSSKLSSAHWIRRMWLGLWTSVSYFGIGSFLIPWWVLGEPYHQIMMAVYRAFMTSGMKI